MPLNRSPGGIRPGRRKQLELGITPLIDIVFLLLIFFMLTSRFVAQEGIQVQLPVTEKAQSLKALERVRIYLMADGVVLFLGETMSLRDLEARLASSDDTLLDKPFEIMADRNAPVQEVVALLEILRNRGASRVTIGTVSSPGRGY